MKISEVEEQFVSFYQKSGYQLLPRAPMLDDSIPMSFVMSAGLVQVENSLAKMHIREKEKFVLVQDCFRHFDLDRVGTDDIHLSIFKMPGAFMFASNSKIKTVERMWSLATSVLGLEVERLWVSYFSGGMIEGKLFSEDHAMRQAWLKVGVPENHIIGLGPKANFWLQGKGFDDVETTRKSGPNTELFFDRGIERACSRNCLPGCGCGRFIEFSNSLFICYEIDKFTGEFQLLENPFSETVIGAERVAMIMQSSESVFDIENFRNLIQIIRNYSQSKSTDRKLLKIGERIIADHLRALVFLISDNAPPPGKNGRQRLIKKLIRGLMTGMQVLEIADPAFLEVALEDQIRSIDYALLSIEEIFERFYLYYSMQESCFMSTIQRGKRELNNQLRKSNQIGLSGDKIVTLEKQWGIPYLLIAKDLMIQGIQFPEFEYKNALNDWSIMQAM